MVIDDRELHEECGVFGVYEAEDAARLTYYGLHALQHRGQEGAGICVRHNKLHLHKGEGLVTEVFDKERLKQLPGNAAIVMCVILLPVVVVLPMFSHSYLEQ